MQAIIFIGIQASGKSTFYVEHFFDTHMRISMDLLNTRNKETQFLQKCLDLQQSVVIDNTNPTKADRERYIRLFKENNYEVVGYYFQSVISDAMKRNERREGKKKIPELGISATYKKLELPSYEEGFDQLYYVTLGEAVFNIEKWQDEI